MKTQTPPVCVRSGVVIAEALMLFGCIGIKLRQLDGLWWREEWEISLADSAIPYCIDLRGNRVLYWCLRHEDGVRGWVQVAALR